MLLCWFIFLIWGDFMKGKLALCLCLTQLFCSIDQRCYSKGRLLGNGTRKVCGSAVNLKKRFRENSTRKVITLDGLVCSLSLGCLFGLASSYFLWKTGIYGWIGEKLFPSDFEKLRLSAEKMYLPNGDFVTYICIDYTRIAKAKKPYRHICPYCFDNSDVNARCCCYWSDTKEADYVKLLEHVAESRKIKRGDLRLSARVDTGLCFETLFYNMEEDIMDNGFRKLKRDHSDFRRKYVMNCKEFKILNFDTKESK